MATISSCRLSTESFFTVTTGGDVVVVVILISSSGLNCLAFSCLLCLHCLRSLSNKKTCLLRLHVFSYINSKNNLNAYKKLFMVMYTFFINVIVFDNINQQKKIEYREEDISTFLMNKNY